jgi:CheY-like chemotaxis protein
VLLADDNRTNQRLVELFLETDRHRVTTVSNGADAILKSAEQPFDLILMDVQMPEMDGFEATAAIRERERTTGVRTPIVALTAHAMAGDREKCLAAGMDAYLAKPIRPDDLASTIALFSAGAAVRPADARQRPRSAVSIQEATLLADFGQNEKVLAEVIGVFLVDAPRYLDAIRQAGLSGDREAAAAAAHALKGSAGLFSNEAYESVRALEHAIKGGDPTADARRQEVETRVAQLCAELDAFRQKLQGAI